MSILLTSVVGAVVGAAVEAWTTAALGSRARRKERAERLELRIVGERHDWQPVVKGVRERFRTPSAQAQSAWSTGRSCATVGRRPPPCEAGAGGSPTRGSVRTATCRWSLKRNYCGWVRSASRYPWRKARKEKRSACRRAASRPCDSRAVRRPSGRSGRRALGVRTEVRGVLPRSA